jgi:hypothetical protein
VGPLIADVDNLDVSAAEVIADAEHREPDVLG